MAVEAGRQGLLIEKPAPSRHFRTEPVLNRPAVCESTKFHRPDQDSMGVPVVGNVDGQIVVWVVQQVLMDAKPVVAESGLKNFAINCVAEGHARVRIALVGTGRGHDLDGSGVVTMQQRRVDAATGAQARQAVPSVATALGTSAERNWPYRERGMFCVGYGYGRRAAVVREPSGAGQVRA